MTRGEGMGAAIWKEGQMLSVHSTDVSGCMCGGVHGGKDKFGCGTWLQHGALLAVIAIQRQARVDVDVAVQKSSVYN